MNNNYSIHLGDCMPWLKSLEPASVDCVFVDLPYYGVVNDDWDNQWNDRNEYLDWVVALELGRRFLGCELKPEYFDIAEKRIQKAAQQMVLLTV